MPAVSVVVPVYGCEACLRDLVGRVGMALDQAGVEREIVLVCDGSPDGSWETISSIVAADPSVTGLRLSRNFGQHAAITAGLAAASGDRVVVMDCDLQDPPEVIPQLLVASESAEIVYARRVERPVGVARRKLNDAYFWFLARATGASLDASYGTFSVLHRNVVEAFLQLGDVERHYLFILHWLGFTTAEVEYVHAERQLGVSSYTWRRLVAHAISGVFFQTAMALRWIVLLGFLVSFSGVSLALFLIIRYLTSGAAEGWTSIAVLVLVLSGVIIASTGVAALYVGRIYEQVKQRPLFVVAEHIGGGAEAA